MLSGGGGSHEAGLGIRPIPARAESWPQKSKSDLGSTEAVGMDMFEKLADGMSTCGEGSLVALCRSVRLRGLRTERQAAVLHGAPPNLVETRRLTQHTSIRYGVAKVRERKAKHLCQVEASTACPK